MSDMPEPNSECSSDADESLTQSSETLNSEAAAAKKEELRLAMKAFRKKLKLMKLDDESRLGRGPMSGGGRSGVVAITPPNQFSREVWEELVEQGKLRRAGRGIYELVDL
jgi:hypothetical protein